MHPGAGDAPDGTFCCFECFGEYARGYLRAGDVSAMGERLKRQKGIEYARWAMGFDRIKAEAAKTVAQAEAGICIPVNLTA
jgi:hypothetical protein